jgi:hypothetical protein
MRRIFESMNDWLMISNEDGIQRHLHFSRNWSRWIDCSIIPSFTVTLRRQINGVGCFSLGNRENCLLPWPSYKLNTLTYGDLPWSWRIHFTFEEKRTSNWQAFDAMGNTIGQSMAFDKILIATGEIQWTRDFFPLVTTFHIQPKRIRSSIHPPSISAFSPPAHLLQFGRSDKENGFVRSRYGVRHRHCSPRDLSPGAPRQVGHHNQRHRTEAQSARQLKVIQTCLVFYSDALISAER